MKKLLIIIVSIAVCVWLASDIWARGGRGGGGGGGRGGGGGGAGGGGARAGARPGGGARPVAAHVPVAVHVRVVVHAEWRRMRIMLPVLRRCRGRVLRTFEDRVGARLQIIGHRWVICPRREVAQARGPEIGPAVATLPIGRTRCNRPGGGNIANRPNAGARRRCSARRWFRINRRITTGGRRTTVDARCAKLSWPSECG